MKMQSMNYGQLPTKAQWDEHWEALDNAGELRKGRYHITLSHSDSRIMDGFRLLGDGEYTCDSLWNAVSEIVNAEPDAITVSEDEEFEDTYQVFYPSLDRVPFAVDPKQPEYIEIGPDDEDLISWASKFSEGVVESRSRAIEALNYAVAYGSTGKCYARQDAALDLVSSILETMRFEWI